MTTSRRGFLQAPAALAAAPAAAPLLPTIRLGNYQVTRLIVGANPFYGFSHFNRLLDQHMLEWCTPENVWKTVRACEENGINTWQLSDAKRGLEDVRGYRERGGKIQWILLSSRRMEEDLSLIPKIAALGPIGIVHHGGTTDRRWRAGEQNKIKEFLKTVRDSGVLVGLSTHNPLVIEEVQSQGWDVDFFMASAYRITRTEAEVVNLLGQQPLGGVYLPQDPPRMYRAVRQTPKPCLVFKILAAGRLTDTPQALDRAFQSAFDSIKPTDGVIVGMYPRYSDQVRDNAERVRRILGKS